ncbi:MAG: glycosyltransferase [Planctomycetota bacterium]
MSSIALVTLVNDPAQLDACRASLAAQVEASPEWLAVEPNRRGWNAAQGLNHGIDRLDAEWVVCVHQDVLFPPGFWARFSAALAALPADAALAGIVGCDRDGRYRGHICDPNGHCYWGPLPCRVLALDEVLIAVRKSAGLHFCEEVPGFHCYGADLCFEADRRGRSVHAIDAPLVHLSTGRLDASYDLASQWLLAKWGARYGHVLPMPTLVVQDENRAGFVHRTLVRWRRRRDRLARNTNSCADAACAARELWIGRQGAGGRP